MLIARINHWQVMYCTRNDDDNDYIDYNGCNDDDIDNADINSL